MFATIYKRAREKQGPPQPLGRVIFDESEIQSYATIRVYSDFLFGKVTDGFEFFISLDGSSENMLWRILETAEIAFERERPASGIHRYRLAMDKLPDENPWNHAGNEP